MNLLKKGFTLAEILITMGIIGVVAAIVIPDIMVDTSRKQLETKLIIFSTQLEKMGRTYHEEVDLLNADELRDLLSVELLFNDPNAISGDEVKILKDGTAIRIRNTDPTRYTGDSSTESLSNSGIIRFYPNVVGLGGNNVFDFYITQDGTVYPNGNDACTIKLYENKYKAVKFYNGAECNNNSYKRIGYNKN